ncbi:AAA-domain-containing protein [Plenodomus tracheiphilus IPT5]|uniref:AAA-domain-containing protein n=1 Tax=Plenodomus tracheiphilus IPT5 TaxID=1408161 RepID=A0A6A7B0A9_9PLEO|nr:AAA-domain-containing protein [Plenodomus tracheiphilus IPT5]
MYVIRSALRASTGRPPARFIRGRRYPSTPRLRPFHTTRQLAQAANPPPTPGSTPTDHDATKKTDDEAATAERRAEATIASEDPDVLAQKLQRSRETTRRYSAALRRQQRGRKTEGLPPVHIPDWFLKRRVIRREDRLQESKEPRGLPLLSVTLSHKDSGEHATCSIPAGIELDAPLVLARLVRGLWGQRLDTSERLKLELYLSERIELDDKAGTPDVQPQDGDAVAEMQDVSQSATSKDVQSTSDSRPSVNEDADLLNVAKASGHTLKNSSTEAATKQNAKLERASKRRAAAKARDSGRATHISPLIAAEIRATIAASLCTLQPAAGDSFPSTKTNVILHAPTAEQERVIDRCVFTNALELGADVIALQALDLAQLAGDYLGEGPEPSPRSIRSLGYETYRLSSELRTAVHDIEESAEDESQSSVPSAMGPPAASRVYAIPFVQLPSMLRNLIMPDGGGMGSPASGGSSSIVNDEPTRTQTQSDLQLEDIKITNLLEALIDANEAKQSRGLVSSSPSQLSQGASRSGKALQAPAFFDYSMGSDDAEFELNSTLPASAKDTVEFLLTAGSAAPAPKDIDRSKIIYVRDFKEMNATHYGGRILQKLEEVVRRRRISGERIMILGITCSRDLTPEISHSAPRDLQSEGESSPFRTIVVTPEANDNFTALEESFAAATSESTAALGLTLERKKFQQINAMHVRNMLQSLDPVAAASISDMDSSPPKFRAWAPVFSSSYTQRVLTYDEVHRIALTALGLLVTDRARAIASDNTLHQVNWAHVALAIGLLEASDASKSIFFDTLRGQSMSRNPVAAKDRSARAAGQNGKGFDEASLKRQRALAQIAESATKYEKRLMPGIADPDQIKTTFDQVHVPKETVDSLRTITSLSLLRPEAFSYGILATEKISGALLYGPPGTGKTLLAKAVAKQSGSTVLEVSGSQIMDKYVGEGEKNVAAVFSLARKLSPCIVFLDEADAVFASRDAMRERTSHRDILNQFLKEWDGLNDMSVFVMVATNRPFDLDDAVIRRLPRRLLVDLPTQTDRKEILRIHLTGEQLDDSVDLEDLAKRTPFYSGSDLKNVAVSAALACVKEENEQAAIAAAVEAVNDTGSSSSSSDASNSTIDSTMPSAPSASTNAPFPIPIFPSPPTPTSPPHLVRGQIYKFPEKRILHPRHFDKALREISASISEDMSSLSAIKKFDEQYGDRKGNKRRKDFGFGMLAERNESAARVRI